MTDLEMQLTDLEARVDDELVKFASEWRRLILIPFCRRRKLTALFGNGEWFFVDSRGRDANDRLPESITQALNTAVPSTCANAVFGHYIANVRKSDLQGQGGGS